MKYNWLPIIVSLAIQAPICAEAGEVWDCQPNWMPPGSGSYLFRVDGSNLVVPAADPGMGVAVRVPIVRNNNEVLIAITNSEKSHEFEIIIIDKQVNRIRIADLNTMNGAEIPVMQFRGPCKKVH